MTTARSRRRFLRVALAAGLVSLGGCGQKGPLYFREDKEEDADGPDAKKKKTSAREPSRAGTA